jgi:hypothetical protein
MGDKQSLFKGDSYRFIDYINIEEILSELLVDHKVPASRLFRTDHCRRNEISQVAEFTSSFVLHKARH